MVAHFPAGGQEFYDRLRHATSFFDNADIRPEPVGPGFTTETSAGHLDRDGRRVTLDEVSVPRPGQRFAFVMDTGLCDNVFALAQGADMLVIESTFLAQDAATAAQVGHLTAGQAARVAQQSGVRTLVLTHFSQRYADATRFLDEARVEFDGEIVVAEDLIPVPVPARSTVV